VATSRVDRVKPISIRLSCRDAPSHREPVAIFTGEVLAQYAGDLDDGTVRELLDELATQMGQCLEQVRRALPVKFIHIAQILNGAAE
jgi:hypothetical protein